MKDEERKAGESRMTAFFLHNGKCRVLSGTSLSALRQELKDFLVSHKNPDIKQFLPAEIRGTNGSRKMALSQITEPFQVIAIARTRKGYRLVSAFFSLRGELLKAWIPKEVPPVVKEKIETWGNSFKGILRDRENQVKKLRVEALLKGL